MQNEWRECTCALKHSQRTSATNHEVFRDDLKPVNPRGSVPYPQSLVLATPSPPSFPMDSLMPLLLQRGSWRRY